MSTNVDIDAEIAATKAMVKFYRLALKSVRKFREAGLELPPVLKRFLMIDDSEGWDG